MKCLHIAWSILLLTWYTQALQSSQNYQQIITQRAVDWTQAYQETLRNPGHVQTLIDVILLSYQIAQESCCMIIAKLTLQEEIFKIYTPSLIDSWQTNLQVLHNDTSKLELALQNIKTSQQHCKILFEKLKSVGPRLIQINPQPTQTLIADLKQALLVWTQQQNLSSEIDTIQQEFTSAIETISDIKILFEITLQSPDIKNSCLKEAAGCVSKSYQDIESVFNHFTKLRKHSMYQIEKFFNCFFKTYYAKIYEIMDTQQIAGYKTIAWSPEKLPAPDLFFNMHTAL